MARLITRRERGVNTEAKRGEENIIMVKGAERDNRKFLMALRD